MGGWVEVDQEERCGIRRTICVSDMIGFIRFKSPDYSKSGGG